jgi:hypothetical protein
MTNTSSKQKQSIVKGTKEGALYITISDLLNQPDIKELISRFEKSEIRKRILNSRVATGN